MPNIDIENFSGGVTLFPVVRANEPRVMKTLDGFFIDKREATCRDGTAKKSSSYIALNAAHHSPFVGKFGAYPWVMAVDSDGYNRYMRVGSDSNWVAANASLAAVPPADSKCTKCDDLLIIPTTGGVKRLEPAWVDGTAPDWDAVQDTQLHACDTPWDEQSPHSPASTTTGASKLVARKEGTGALAIQITTSFAPSGSATILCSDVVTSTDLTDLEYITLWVYSSYDIAAGKLQFLIDETAACASPSAVNFPALYGGRWNRVALDISGVANADKNAVISVGIRTSTTWTDSTYAELIIDDIWGANEVATAPKTGLLSPKGPLNYSAWARPTLLTRSGTASVLVEDCEDDWDKIAQPAGVLARSVCTTEGYFKQGSGSLHILISGLAASTAAATEQLASAVDLTGHDYIGLWIYSQGSLAADKLELRFYDDAACSAVIETVSIDTPLTVGWNYVTKQITKASYGTLEGIGLRTSATWTVGSDVAALYIDSVQGVDSTTDTYWSTTATQYEYCYCFAGPKRRNATEYEYWVSNPSMSQRASEIAAGQTMAVGCYTYTAKNDWDATDILVGRRAVGAADFEYIGKVDITSESNNSTVTFTDYGQTSTDPSTIYDAGLGLPQYLEFNHDAAPIAHHVMAADHRLYLAGIGYDTDWISPLDMAVSSYDAIHLFPTSPESGSEATDGCLLTLSKLATSSSEIVGMGLWQGRKLVGTDAETFWLQGDSYLDFNFVRLAGIGWENERSGADCEGEYIWLSPQGFYSYSSAGVRPISKLRIDHSLIDTTVAMDGVFWNGRYVFYCTYNSTPSLLIYEIAAQAWVVHSLTNMPLLGIGVDRSTDTIYGVARKADATRGYVVELFNSASTTDINSATGATQAITYTLETHPVRVGSLGDEYQTKYLAVEANASAAAIVTADTYGEGLLDNNNTALSLTLGGNASGMRVKENCNVKGSTFRIKLGTDDADLTSIRALTLVCGDMPLP